MTESKFRIKPGTKSTSSNWKSSMISTPLWLTGSKASNHMVNDIDVLSKVEEVQDIVLKWLVEPQSRPGNLFHFPEPRQPKLQPHWLSAPCSFLESLFVLWTFRFNMTRFIAFPTNMFDLSLFLPNFFFVLEKFTSKVSLLTLRFAIANFVQTKSNVSSLLGPIAILT